MLQNSLVLLLILTIAVAGKNSTVAVAVAIMLLMQLTPLRQLFPAVADHAIPIGLVLLILGVLVPFGTGQLGMEHVVETFRTPTGLLAITGGAVSAYLSGRGIALLELAPEVIVGVIMGTLVGIIFLRGVPVGPLVAAGVTAMLLGLTRTQP